MVIKLLESHFTLLQNSVAPTLPSDLAVKVVAGGWSVLPQAFRDTNRDVQALAPDGTWGEAIGSLADATVREIRGSEDVRRLIGEPLWPVAGDPSVVRLLLADGSKLSEMADTRLRDAAWAVMCQVEQHTWDCLTLEIVKQSNTVGNPLFPLIRIYSLGYYPIGLAETNFIVFRLGA